MTNPHNPDDLLAGLAMSGDFTGVPTEATDSEPENNDQAAPPPAPEEESEKQAPLPEFDPRHRDPFLGLLFLGRLTDEFVVWGHRFRIMTPSGAERLEIGPLIERYQGTLAQESAYVAATVAAYLVKVDNQDLPQPISPDSPKESALMDRWNWVNNNLHHEVQREVFQKCLILDGTVHEVLEAMGKA